MSDVFILVEHKKAAFCKECLYKKRGDLSCSEQPAIYLAKNAEHGFHCSADKYKTEVPYERLTELKNKSTDAKEKAILTLAMKYRRLRECQNT